MATVRRLSSATPAPSRGSSSGTARGSSSGKKITPSKAGRGSANRVSSKLELTLPTEKSQPIKSIEDAVIALYGEKKIGKTSLAGEFDDPFFMMCEPGGKGLSIAQRPVSTWAEFVGYVDLLCKTDRFRTIIVDTIDKAYEKAFDFVCKREVMVHPGDEAYGKGWKMIDQEFTKQLDRLVHSGRGVVFISHAEVREFQSRTGDKYSKIVPSMSASARRYVSGIADVIAYYGYYGAERYLTIRGSDTLEAGHRLKYQFWTPEGERVQSIPMFSKKNKSFGETEAYANLVKAFNNEQLVPGDLELETSLSETPVKRQASGRR